MITIINKDVNKNPDEIVLLSTDTKPTNVLNGSIAFEIDTGNFYVFNADGPAWVEIEE